MRLVPTLIFSSTVLIATNFVSAKTPQDAASTAAATGTSTLTPSSTAVPAATATPAVVVPEPKPIKNKKWEFSTRTEVHPCSSGECSIDTFVIAKKVENGELDWERRIYFRVYEFGQDAAAAAIPVKSLKLVGSTLLHAVN